MFGTLGLAFLAGCVSVLSPCVIPLLPVVLGAAVAQHRLAPIALAFGLALSFTAVGIFVATIGFTLGIDGGVFRNAGAIVLALVGGLLLLPALQTRLAVAAGPAGNWVDQHFGGFSSQGISGQFGVGLLLGFVWVPCVGPTLGAASLLAARGENLGAVAVTMAAFGIGSSVPLIALGLLSRETVLRLRSGLLGAGKNAKYGMGLLFIAMAVAILTGADHRLETVLVDWSPSWLTAFTTRF
ncbi:MAG: cytochrome C biogenesis protein [Bradyrhizobium sp. PARBB1]|nr:MAG: cytochrome C biogenesis protein [Bradyrhizobium sp. PARBB1]